MQFRFIVILLAFPFFAFAQSQKGEPYYYQQNAIQAQISISDCYHQNLDAGIAAKSRNDCRTALKYFREARDCAEAKDNTRRISEIDALIEGCESVPAEVSSVVAKAKSQRPKVENLIPSRRYLPSIDFLYFKGDTCFEVTRREADRAFAQRCWDDAAKLYRAAKSCSDADQAERAAMNEHLTACRNAAEDELRQKEQEALRRARHAIADNLADNAQDELQLFNRSLAYRLADFANEYVAPDDNPRCIQALLDAWYFIPAIDIENGYSNSRMRVPFCYQLAGNMPSAALIRCLGKGKNAKIYVLSPSNHKLYSWNIATFEAQEAVEVEENVLDFDVSPDGKTLLFITSDGFVFWRGPKQSIKVSVQYVSSWCFSPRGDVFYAFNSDAQTISVLSLKDAFMVTKKGPARNLVFSNYITGVQSNLFTFTVYDGKFWLGYPDRVEILVKPENGKPWKRQQTIRFGQTLSDYRALHLFPSQNKVVMSGDSVLVFNLPQSNTNLIDTLLPNLAFPANVLAMHEKTDMIANLSTGKNGNFDRLIVSSLEDGVAQYGALMNSEEWYSYMPGAFSPDGKWVFAVSNTGVLNAWNLINNEFTALQGFEDAYSANISPDGQHLVTEKFGQLEVLQTSNMKQTAQVLAVPTQNFYLKAVSNDWVAYRDGRDSLVLQQISSNRKWYFPVNAESGANLPIAFSNDDKLVAYTNYEKSVTVRSLEDGTVRASRAFDESVAQLRFVPNAQDIVVVQADKNAYNEIEQSTIAKIWNYGQPNAKPRVVRLHGYKIEFLELTAQGNRIAFSDGHDIRIFNLNNLADEITRIHRDKALMLTAMTFHPDGSAVAAAYDDGSIEFWDTEVGEPQFKLHRATLQGDPRATALRFIDGGQRLQQVNMDRVYIVRDLAPALIGEQVQTDYRKLLAFTAEQIRDYDLEKALNYPGNFERLAKSGEWPLIRSFFDYFYLQSLRSNNIARVDEYCNRALILYQQLDEGTQRSLRPTILEMFRDLNWKWLLRGGTEQANAVVGQIERNFNDPLVAEEAGAFTALQRGDLKKATSLFTDLTIRSYQNIRPEDYNSWALLDTLKTKIRQLAEYDLLEAPQVACICGLYSELLDIQILCPQKGDLSAVPCDAETRLRWNIFQSIYKSQTVFHHERKDEALQAALEDAKRLQKQKSPIARTEMEHVILEIVKNELSWGIFEQSSPLSIEHYQKALNLLNTLGPPSPNNDTMRLALLTRTLLAIGGYELAKENIPGAIRVYESGLQTVSQLLATVKDTIARINYRADLLAVLYERLGSARLLMDSTGAARKAFDQANSALYYTINNYYTGHAALLEGDETEALINYGDISNEDQLGQVLFDIDRFATRFPAKRDSLRAFMPRLKAAALAVKPFNKDIVDYAFANKKTLYFDELGKWDSCLYWSTIALRFSEKALNQPSPPSKWKDYWLDEHVRQSYYIVMSQWRDTAALSAAIHYAEKAQLYVENIYNFYPNRDYLKTNLAHAYWLRNQPGDRGKAIENYQAFLASRPFYGRNNWELLEKDFRDFVRAGVQWPLLDEMISAIKATGLNR